MAADNTEIVRPGITRVVLACKALSVLELRSDRSHDVRSMRILMTTDREVDSADQERVEGHSGSKREVPKAGDYEQLLVDCKFPPVTDDRNSSGREGGEEGEEDEAVSPVPLVKIHYHHYNYV